MKQVFISYRQTDNEQRERVRAFGERLRRCGINVVLDQFFLDDNPAGPDEGWPKWSSDCAFNAEYVLIIGTSDWFQCFEKKQRPGTGLGAAWEANDIRTRIYEAAGLNRDIRVVLFDDADRVHIPRNLSPYHHFHAMRDFASIVRWLGGTFTVDAPRTSIPHNLPVLQPFFGREEELSQIADALDPESRTWGALVDGPGGIGKTSLAVRAAYDASPAAFDRIVFISLKSRELDDGRMADFSGFLISGLAELLNELARELGHVDIAKAPQKQRPRMLIDALRGTRTLLVLDNLESLLKTEREIVFDFVKILPPGCKAILTSRVRIGSVAEELILEKLSRSAALATLAKLAESNPTLGNTSEAERVVLYRETGGNPLLLRWTAGQIGRGSCVTVTDAVTYLRSCPEDNDPLEFIFADLIEDFSEAETRVLCALTYFTPPAKLKHISEVADRSEADTEQTLRILINRSLVVPSQELKTFALVPLVADFLRNKKSEVVAQVGDRLESLAYTLVVENGYEKFDRFPVLNAAWPMVAAALPRFLAGTDQQLQTVCEALFQPCNYSGHYDESLALHKRAESRAKSAGNFSKAGWRAYESGWVHSLRAESGEVLACAARAEAHWRKAQAGTREIATALHLRGIGHELANENDSAIAAYREAVELWRTLGKERDVALGLTALADAERLSGNVVAAEREYSEALRISRTIDYRESIATNTCNLAQLALECEDLPKAETLALEALTLSEEVGRLELIGGASYLLAKTLVKRGRKAEGLPHANRAVDIYTDLGSPELENAREILMECEN